MSKNHTKQQIDQLLKVCKKRAEIDVGINFATGKKERTPSPRVQMIGRTAHVPGALELGSSADIPQSLQERDHGIASGLTTLPSCDDDIESALHKV